MRPRDIEPGEARRRMRKQPFHDISRDHEITIEPPLVPNFRRQPCAFDGRRHRRGVHIKDLLRRLVVPIGPIGPDVDRPADTTGRVPMSGTMRRDRALCRPSQTCGWLVSDIRSPVAKT